MKKKITLIFPLIFSIFISGCSSDSSNDNTGADEKDFGYSASYNTLSNTKQVHSSMAETEEGIIVFPIYNEQNLTAMAYKSHGDRTLKMIEPDPSTNCSIDNLSKCSNHIKGTDSAFFTIYNNQIYYVDTKFDEKSDESINVLVKTNLEGYDVEEVYRFENAELNDYNFFLEFHQNYIYYCIGKSGIQRINMADYKKDKNFIISKDEVISDMYFYGNEMYFTIDNYKYKDTLYPSAIQCLDLKTNKIEFIVDKSAYLIDKENMICVEPQDDSYVTYFYNRRTNEAYKLFDTPSLWVFRYNYYYVIDSVGMADDEGLYGSLYLVDLNGQILDTIENPYIGFKWGQGVVKDKYYVYDQVTMQFFYFEIKDGKFSERKELAYE